MINNIITLTKCDYIQEVLHTLPSWTASFADHDWPVQPVEFVSEQDSLDPTSSEGMAGPSWRLITEIVSKCLQSPSQKVLYVDP